MVPCRVHYICRVILTDPIHKAVKQTLTLILCEIAGELCSLDCGIAMIYQDMV